MDHEGGRVAGLQGEGRMEEDEDEDEDEDCWSLALVSSVKA